MNIVELTQKFALETDRLEFTFDGYVYNPLVYAWQPHKYYLEKYVKPGVRALFLGMNPGPFGMMQTGIPFGEINAVKDYLGICATVGKPVKEHPGRPVEGFDVRRSEISGKRLWGLISKRFPDPEDFFKDYAVFNYCPLGFLSSVKTAKNITPDKLPKSEQIALESVCDCYLKEVIDMLNPSVLIGVGKYAMHKLQSISDRTVISIIHPSPGNPQANSGWEEKTERTLRENGLWN